jgi:hypothetical protein
MLAKGAGASDHLPSLQATFLTRLLDIRTSSSYTSGAIVPPEPVDLHAFAQSFEHRNHETNWPPAPLANLVSGSAIPEQDLSGNPIIPMTETPGREELQDQPPVLPPIVGVGTPFDLNTYLGLSNNSLDAGTTDPFGMADMVQGGNSRNPFTPGIVNPFPDVPVASLGLTMGNFMNDQGVMDVLFANDGLW